MSEPTEPWLLLTPAQVKEGWFYCASFGAAPVRRSFIVLAKRPDGLVAVRNPALQILEEEKIDARFLDEG